MSQHTAGKATFTQGNATVTGSADCGWVGIVKAGMAIKRLGSAYPVVGTIAADAVLVGGVPTIQLMAPWAGTSAVATDYLISTGYTPNLGLGEIGFQDADWAFFLTQRVIRPLDQAVASLRVAEAYSLSEANALRNEGYGIVIRADLLGATTTTTTTTTPAPTTTTTTPAGTTTTTTASGTTTTTPAGSTTTTTASGTTTTTTAAPTTTTTTASGTTTTTTASGTTTTTASGTTTTTTTASGTTTTTAAGTVIFHADFENETGDNADWTLSQLARSTNQPIAGSYSLYQTFVAQGGFNAGSCSKTINIPNGATISFRGVSDLSSGGGWGGGVIFNFEVDSFIKSATQVGDTYSWVSDLTSGDHSFNVSISGESQYDDSDYVETTVKVWIDEVKVTI